jgi:hypothetical protein
MKNKLILISFGLNVAICLASCSYFGAAESKMQEYKKLKEVDKAAREIVEDVSLFAPVEELENAVAQDLAALDTKYKNLN